MANACWSASLSKVMKDHVALEMAFSPVGSRVAGKVKFGGKNWLYSMFYNRTRSQSLVIISRFYSESL